MFRTDTCRACHRLLVRISCGLLLSCVLLAIDARVADALQAEAEPSDASTQVDVYHDQVAVIFDRYCVSCHNSFDREGGLSMETFEELLEGGERGPALLAGDPDSSRLIRMIRGDVEPVMPPDDMEGPTDEELSQLVSWIVAGAPGPTGTEPMTPRLLVPELATPSFEIPTTAADWNAELGFLAIAVGENIHVFDDAGQSIYEIDSFANQINDLHFSKDGSWLVAAGGTAGLVGVSEVWNAETGESIVRVEGHRDSLYAADINPDATAIATAGYDKSIQLWDVASGEMLRTFRGHNQPIFDLEFDSSGEVLLSASADETLKLWRVGDAMRLDTLGQPLAEQYAGRFTPDGQFIVGTGADNRVRVWRFVSKDRPQINPLLVSRYAHEASISHIDFSQDGSKMVTVSEDQTIKIWDTQTWTEIQLLEDQPDIVSSVAMTPDGGQLFVVRIDGSTQRYQLVSSRSVTQATSDADVVTRVVTGDMIETTEQEPNDQIEVATVIDLPASIKGHIDPEDRTQSDSDFFRFEAKEGESWILEINAARQGSPLDSRIEILDEDGDRVVRTLMQAVRDSYFTFRGKDSNTSDDFRVHNWEEMELNEYLYANGEIVRLWLYPRGPDSGFKVYPGFGSRHAFFDTSPLSHALQQPCFIVRPTDADAELIPTGLPVFPVYFENDDDSKRKLGTDSKLLFTVPKDGTYFVRVMDTRGFGGESYQYELQIRPPNPDFRVSIANQNPKVSPGGAREFMINVERLDYFDGPIHVEIENVPDGFQVQSPITIESGQFRAVGLIWADDDATTPIEEQMNASTATASAMIGDQLVSHQVNSLGQIELAEPNVVQVRMFELTDHERARATSADPLATVSTDDESRQVSITDEQRQPLDVLEIRPGETVVAKVRVERNGFTGRISFGKEDSGRNLPHGVYVDNIGLNGLMIIEGHVERSFFVTAADWVEPQERYFHLRAETQGGQASYPVLLRILPRD